MHDSTSILDRLERLERQNRRWKRGAALAAILLVSALSLGLSGPRDDLLEGSGLVLRNAAGETWASIELDGQQKPLLLLKDGDSHVAITLNGPALHLRAPGAKRSAFLGIDTRGATRLELTGESTMGGVRAGVGKGGISGLYLLDDEGFDRATMEYHPDGNAVVTVRGERSGVRGTFGLDRDGNASSLLLDTSGRRRLGMLVPLDGIPILSMEDEEGRPRANLTMKFDGTPRLEMLRPDGRPSFEAP